MPCSHNSLHCDIAGLGSAYLIFSCGLVTSDREGRTGKINGDLQQYFHFLLETDITEHALPDLRCEELPERPCPTRAARVAPGRPKGERSTLPAAAAALVPLASSARLRDRPQQLARITFPLQHFNHLLALSTVHQERKKVCLTQSQNVNRILQKITQAVYKHKNTCWAEELKAAC